MLTMPLTSLKKKKKMLPFFFSIFPNEIVKKKKISLLDEHLHKCYT
jgi:hypothetical protein